jgi:CubicO group peptidase (beta-lactamase class C family)
LNSGSDTERRGLPVGLPEQGGFTAAALDEIRRWLERRAGKRGSFRVVIVRHGHVVAEWNKGIDRSLRLPLASAAKSILSSMLAIAIAEGKIASVDARIIDYFPESMEVPEGAGPKPGRHVFAKDLDITFKQLISNTSGYMKPGELPGRVFHYQTFGMSIVGHAIAKQYGMYDVTDPEGSPGLGRLTEEKLARPIGASWDYYLENFNHDPGALVQIFGNFDGVKSNAVDMATLGWLWRNRGLWGDERVIPDGWMRQAVQTAPQIVRTCPEQQWMYGLGFWCNDYGKLWPDLPRDSFAAAGAGSQHIWVCPSLDLVIAQSPGLWRSQKENNDGLVRLVVEACVRP